MPSRLGAAVALIAAAGCAGPSSRLPLADATRARIHSGKVVAALHQQEIRVLVVPHAGGAAFGLIGALIDSSADRGDTEVAEKAVVPVRNALLGYETEHVLSAALTRNLASLDWFKDRPVEVRQIGQDLTWRKEVVARAGTDVVLLIDATYSLGPRFEAVVIEAWVSVLEQPAVYTGAMRPLFSSFLQVKVPLPGNPPGSLDEAAALWAADGGRLARRALDGGFAELAEMTAFELSRREDEADVPVTAEQVACSNGFGYRTAPGAVLRQVAGRQWVRLPDGPLYSVGDLYP